MPTYPTEVEMLRRRVDDLESIRDQLLAQLPEGMKHCTIIFKECGKGHGRLTAKNWIDHGCQKCAMDELTEKFYEVRGQRDKLLAFKAWVHNYLDQHGVPKEFPDGPHTKEGCRIGDRMDWLTGEIVRLKRGDFTPEEFQYLCHHRDERPGCTQVEFMAGCNEYVKKLFGSGKESSNG